MNPINSIYGHDLVLALASGFDGTVRPIWGVLQHAWMPDLPFWEGERHSPRWPIFVYSTANLRAARAWDNEHRFRILAIGDPFLYLVRLLEGKSEERDPADQRPLGGSVIVYPLHGDGSQPYVELNSRYADFIRAREDGEVTVCLHGHDWHNPAIRGTYRQRGFRVICHGLGSDPHFLLAQHAELLRHDRVVSNVMGTALLHGGALGLRMQVWGPVYGAPDGVSGDLEAWQRARWPEVMGDGIDGREARVLAGTELGADNLRTPSELKQLLGWRGLSRSKARALSPMARLWRLRTSLKSPQRPSPIDASPSNP